MRWSIGRSAPAVCEPRHAFSADARGADEAQVRQGRGEVDEQHVPRVLGRQSGIFGTVSCTKQRMTLLIQSAGCGELPKIEAGVPVINVAQRQRDRIVTVLAEFFYFLGMRKREPVFGPHEPEHPLPIQ
jgi:hypothetical protein